MGLVPVVIPQAYRPTYSCSAHMKVNKHISRFDAPGHVSPSRFCFPSTRPWDGGRGIPSGKKIKHRAEIPTAFLKALRVAFSCALSFASAASQCPKACVCKRGGETNEVGGLTHSTVAGTPKSHVSHDVLLSKSEITDYQGCPGFVLVTTTLALTVVRCGELTSFR